MKIERISENKIKIFLSEKEITNWNSVYGNRVPDYNSMMLDIISAAEKETGISFHNCRVVVEASQSSKDSYVLIITKTPEKKPYPGRVKPKSYRPKTKLIMPIVAEFNELSDISGFASHYPLYKSMLCGAASLYSYNDKYYLEINLPARFESYRKGLVLSLSEFSTSSAGTVIPYLLPEHGRLLIKDNALSVLSKCDL